MIHLQTFKPREMTKEEVHEQLNKLSSQKGSVIISTCQRMEAYSGFGFVPEPIIKHLFRLASGLESVFLGDTSIQAQVKKAYVHAQQQHELDKTMHRLFQKALHTGKRVRTETHISKGAVNHEQATLQYLKHDLNKLSNPFIAIVGVNALSSGIIHMLKKNKYFNIHLFNRTLSKAQKVAERYKIHSHSLTDLTSELPQADVIISCTSSENAVIQKEMIAPGKNVVAVDLAVPNDFEEDMYHLKNLSIADIQKIEQFIDKNKMARFNEIKRAEGIIEEEIADFLKWQRKNILIQKAA